MTNTEGRRLPESYGAEADELQLETLAGKRTSSSQISPPALRPPPDRRPWRQTGPVPSQQQPTLCSCADSEHCRVTRRATFVKR